MNFTFFSQNSELYWGFWISRWTWRCFLPTLQKL